MAAVPDRATPAPDPPGEVDLPPRVSLSLDDSCLSYMRDRLRQVMFESYAGLPLGKFPEDLRMYEHLLWASRSNVVVEIGCNQGGSALWFRDRLDTMARSADDSTFLLAEQVWDHRPPANGSNPPSTPGENTRSATPLVWTHAQFLRLARSIDAGRPVETPRVVACRYDTTLC